jgi:osmotically-inducible protein OsmY
MDGKTKIEDRVRVAVTSALETERDFNLSKVEMEATGSLVLRGEVASVAAKKRALEVVAAMPEVAAIVDGLRVRPATPMGDAEIRAHLRNAFAGEPAFAALDICERKADASELVRGVPDRRIGCIEYEVDEGVVILNGEVPGLDTKRLAGVLAWWIPGTRDVVNGLVAPLGDDTTGMLQEAVRIVLEKDPFVGAGQIRVGVKGRTVRLTGLVRTDAARDMAERDTWYVFGVDQVINEIAVES